MLWVLIPFGLVLLSFLVMGSPDHSVSKPYRAQVVAMLWIAAACSFLTGLLARFLS